MAMNTVHEASPSLLGEIRQRLQGMARWAELTRNLAVRDVEVRYKHSLLGLYWAIINPLVMAGIFGFVFGVLFKASAPSKIPYVVFLLTNLTFWNFLANGLMSAVGSITGNAQLLAKIYFPRLVLPTASVLARLIDFGFSLLVLVVFILLYRVPLEWTAVFIPFLLLAQVVLNLGLAYLVASLNVVYRDISQLLGLVLMVWMYLSPVMYGVSLAPPALRPVLLLNPMGAILDAEQNLLFTGHLTNASYLWVALAWVLFLYVLGIAMFRRVEPLFAEVM